MVFGKHGNTPIDQGIRYFKLKISQTEAGQPEVYTFWLQERAINNYQALNRPGNLIPQSQGFEYAAMNPTQQPSIVVCSPILGKQPASLEYLLTSQNHKPFGVKLQALGYNSAHEIFI
jgi:hypothetical protein